MVLGVRGECENADGRNMMGKLEKFGLEQGSRGRQYGGVGARLRCLIRQR